MKNEVAPEGFKVMHKVSELRSMMQEEELKQLKLRNEMNELKALLLRCESE